MFFTYADEKWVIKKVPSCFVSRIGKDDVRISKRSNCGGRESDGRLYNCCQIIDAEDGSIIRYDNEVPPMITVDWLKKNGFVNS